MGHLSSPYIVRLADAPASLMWYTGDGNKKREEVVDMSSRCDTTNLEECSSQPGRSKLVRKTVSVFVTVAAALFVGMLVWQRRSDCCATDKEAAA